jgi:hypothetical protein
MANQYAGKASFEIPALKPYRGKPAVRNFRGGDGDVGIIRSPVRAIALPDSRHVGNWRGPIAHVIPAAISAGDLQTVCFTLRPLRNLRLVLVATKFSFPGVLPPGRWLYVCRHMRSASCANDVRLTE